MVPRHVKYMVIRKRSLNEGSCGRVGKSGLSNKENWDTVNVKQKKYNPFKSTIF